MSIYLVSDLHLDHYSKNDIVSILNRILDPLSKEDILIVAGDIADGTRLDLIQHCLEILTDRCRVVYVFGNHEYWADRRLRSIEHSLLSFQSTVGSPNLHILHNSSIELDGIRFSGTTLWYPGLPSQAGAWFVDFDRCIDLHKYHGVWNSNAVRFLRSLPDNRESIFITHHLPSRQFIHPTYKSSKMNCFFASDTSEDLLFKPKHWLFGHTHFKTDEVIKGTRFACNPMGYPSEPNYQGYTPLLIE